MEDIQSCRASLDQLISLSNEMHLNDPSVSTKLAQITDRFHNIQTQAKVLMKSITYSLIFLISSVVLSDVFFTDFTESQYTVQGHPFFHALHLIRQAVPKVCLQKAYCHCLSKIFYRSAVVPDMQPAAAAHFSGLLKVQSCMSIG